jgi:hypothetical protein
MVQRLGKGIRRGSVDFCKNENKDLRMMRSCRDGWLLEDQSFRMENVNREELNTDLRV